MNSYFPKVDYILNRHEHWYEYYQEDNGTLIHQSENLVHKCNHTVLDSIQDM